MKKLKLFLLPIFIFIFIGSYAQNVFYVDVNSASSNPDGSSWADAYPDLQDAINAANPQDVIWVKKGIYLPTETYGTSMSLAQRNKAFILKSAVSIYGGFNGTESSLTERVLVDSNKTILSGHINSGDSTNFAYHVVIGTNVIRLTLDGLTITDGNANTDEDVTVDGKTIRHDYGGGLYLDGATGVTLSNIEFTKNYGTQGGAGANLFDCSSINFDNVSFTDNIIDRSTITKYDQEGGGALRAEKTIFSSIINSTFSNNGCYACQGGGALRIVDASSFDIRNSQFEDNYAFDDEDGGGAVYILDSEVDYTEVTFIKNHAREAGAVYNDGAESVFTDIIFENNSSRNNGGGAMENDVSNVEFDNVIFRGNTTDGDGGAIQNWKSQLILTNVLFENNTAVGDGGAIANWRDCELFMNKTTFVGNTTDGSGGAIYSGGGACEVISTNGLYYQNHAGHKGGAFYTETHSNGPSSVILTNSTVTKNTADTSGGGGYDDGAGNTQIRNSIIHGNYAPDGYDVDVPLTMALTSVHYSIIQNEFHVGGGVYSTFTGEVFADSANNDFTLSATSPALNSGDSSIYDANKTPDLSAITTDLRGGNRIMGDSIDLGAYEMCESFDSSYLSLSTTNFPANNEDTVTFTATVTNGGNNPTYTWYKNDVIIAGETGNEYKAIAGTDIVNHDIIKVQLNSENPCTIDDEAIDSIVIVITGINTIAKKEAKLSIYPNPSTGEFTLDYNAKNSGVVSYIVRDITGKEIYSEKGLNNNTKRFNLDLSNGLYFFTLINEKGEQETLKFIIKK